MAQLAVDRCSPCKQRPSLQQDRRVLLSAGLCQAALQSGARSGDDNGPAITPLSGRVIKCNGDTNRSLAHS